jgi:EpsD family peptidyl-prolyl cis-trans isomerase
MNSRISVMLLALTCTVLASCGDKGEPKGQVVARVDKKEITVLDLQSELNGFQAPNPQIRKAAEQQALNGIIQRKLLAEAAQKQKIDKTPEFARQRQKMEEALLVKTWEDQLARAVPAPSPEEIQKFVNEHPDIYAQRKRISIVGLRFAQPTDPAIFKALQPLNTLPDVQALLTAHNIPFREADGEIDAFAVDPRFVEQIMKLKPDAVFVVPQNGLLMVGRISGMKIDPVPPEIANKHAANYLRSQRTRESLQKTFGSVVFNGLKEVKYNKAYAPPAKPAAKPVAAGAAPPLTPAATAPGPATGSAPATPKRSPATPG